MEELRPTDWQGTDMEHLVDLLRSWDFMQIPSDEVDLNQNLLKFIKLYLLHVIEDLKRIKFLPVKIGEDMLQMQTVPKFGWLRTYKIYFLITPHATRRVKALLHRIITQNSG